MIEPGQGLIDQDFGLTPIRVNSAVSNWPCSTSSRGSPDAHDHAPAPTDGAMLGLAGSEADLKACLDTWTAQRPHLTLSELTLLW